MKLSFTIAFRYLIGKKSRNIINVITFISFTSITVISAALIIILSAFNGLESTVRNVYKAVDPQLKITLKEGKSFKDSTGMLMQIRNLPEVDKLIPVIEESVLLVYDGKQQIGMIKGITPEYMEMVRLDTMVKTGKPKLNIGNQQAAIIGEGMAYVLEVNTDDPTKRLQLYFPKRGKIDLFSPFINRQIVVSGIFSIDHEYTNRCIYTSIPFARELLRLDENVYTGMEIQVSDGTNPNSIKPKLKKILGDNFIIQNRFEQHALMYKVMKGEKLMVFLIITFILIIASFNLIGVLSLMLVEKRKDLMLLNSLGMTIRSIKRIFIVQGMMIALIGCLTGMLIGFLIALSQQKFGFITLSGIPGSRPYPIAFNITDFIIVLAIVSLIALLTSSIRMMVTRFNLRSLSTVLK